MRTDRMILLLALLAIAAVPASAQWIPCLGDPVPPATMWTAPDLPTVPELVSTGGKLRATVVLTDEQQRITFKTPPAAAPSDTNVIKCAPQYVRVFKGIGAMPPIPKTTGDYPDPMPGPTLRARLGDMIELTFLNQINPGDFGDSIDRGDANTGSGCDESSGNPNGTRLGYPQVTATHRDTYPDCFHGSSTANIHFHGTHTNPNSTGDNVFIEIRPSLRADGKPVVTAASVATPFSDFFQRCEAQLGANVLSLWPHTWSDFPSAYTTRQKELLQKYDMTPNIKKLWPVDEAQIKRGDWPQYYVGAYPYCYQLPKYTGTVFPPVDTADHMGHTGGPLSPPPQKPLQMGQSPGLHWYHAHKHGSTAIDVGNGMTGAFVIEGQYDDDFDTFYGAGWTRRQPVLVVNQLGVTPNLERGGSGGTDKGPNFSVNGRMRPVMKMQPGEVKLWRIVNTSGRAGTFVVGMYNSAGQPAVDSSGNPLFTWYQTAQDGVQFSPTNFGSPRFTNNQFLLAAGNRADLLVQAPMAGGVYNLMVKNEVDPQDLATQNLITLFSVNVTGAPATGNAAKLTTTAPTFPPFLTDIQTADVKATKEVTFATLGPGQGGIHTINHKKFDGEVGELVLLNTVEEWKIINETFGPPISHPFHIHINPFQVTEIFDPNAALSTATGAGTLATTSGSAIVTGTGATNFTTVLRTGWVLNIAGQGLKTVLSVQDDTHLTLTSSARATAAGLTYTVNTPQYVFVNSPPPLSDQCYLDPTKPATWKPCASVRQPPAPEPPSSTKNIWWDVFPIPSGITVSWAGTADPVPVAGYFKLRSRFVDYSGYYVIHCHILAHEDRGMMTVVEVAPAASPYSHD
jgi:FtsP/CotA-like multicopper oxidase with cupredoxin domain